jgi:multidrug resistance efflux pump
MNNFHWSKFLLILVVGLFGLTACASASAQPSDQVSPAVPVGLIAQGRLLPANTQDQSFDLPGQVEEVLVADGAQVQAGQVLARLKAGPELALALARAQQELLSAQQTLSALERQAEVALTQARLAVFTAETSLADAEEAYDGEATDENNARVAAAEALLKQTQDTLARLEDGSGVDPDQRAAAQARLLSAQAALTSANAAFDALDLKATIAGVVVDLDLQVGQRVTAGLPVITLADLSRWVVKTDNLTEEEVVQVQAGQAVEVVLDALPEITLSGIVSHINTRYEEKRGDITYTVTITLDQNAPGQRWGMTASLKFAP